MNNESNQLIEFISIALFDDKLIVNSKTKAHRDKVRIYIIDYMMHVVDKGEK